MQAAIKNTSNDIHITVSPKIPLLSVNNKDYEFRDVKEADLLFHIINSNPNVLVYNDIVALILDKYNVANTPYSDKVQYIRKKKLSLQKFLTKTTGINNIIVNIRSVGYKLNSTWKKVENDKIIIPLSKENQLITLDKLVSEVVATMLTCEFNKVKIGNDIFLSLDTTSIKHKVVYFEATYQKMATQILSELHLVKHEFKHLRILEILRTIYSYVTLSRQGSNISDKMWRQLFVLELENHINELKETINQSQP